MGNPKGKRSTPKRQAPIGQGCGRWVVWDRVKGRAVTNPLVGKPFAREARDKLAEGQAEGCPVRGRSRQHGDNGDRPWRFELRRAG